MITKEERNMPYAAINATNAFDASNTQRFSTQEKADARAREILATNPSASVMVVEILFDYRTDLTITAVTPVEPVEETQAASPEPSA